MSLKETVINRKWEILGVIVVAVLGLVVVSFVTVFTGTTLGGVSDGAAAPYTTDARSASLDVAFDRFTSQRALAEHEDKIGAGSFVEVQEARFDIESKDASRDADAVGSLAETHGGYVESSRKRESSLYRTIDLTVRVPDAEFDAFTDSIRAEYEVDSFNVQNYRLSTERDIDELTILNRTMAEYEEMRERIQGMNDSKEKIQLLMELTEKELRVQERIRHYEQELADKRKQGDESTIHVELRERKNVDVWPENLGNRFMNNVKNMLNSVTNIALGTVTQAVVLFFMAVQAIIFLVVVAIPALTAYLLGRRLYNRYWK